jgi:hypothetical protein
VHLFAGEWMLNIEVGVPWFREILGGRFDAERITAILRGVIVGTPGVKSIDKIVATFDGRTREMRVAWTILTVFGDTVEDSLTEVM